MGKRILKREDQVSLLAIISVLCLLTICLRHSIEPHHISIGKVDMNDFVSDVVIDKFIAETDSMASGTQMAVHTVHVGVGKNRWAKGLIGRECVLMRRGGWIHFKMIVFCEWVICFFSVQGSQMRR